MTNNYKPQSADAALVLDVALSALRAAGDPQKASLEVAQALLEVTGAKAVLINRTILNEDIPSYSTVAVVPKRLSQIAESRLVSNLSTIASSLTLPKFYTAEQEKPDIGWSSCEIVNIENAIVSPLDLDPSLRGCLILLDLPSDEPGRRTLLRTINLLSNILALILQNSLIHKELEAIVDIRTEKLRNEIIERKKAEKLLQESEKDLKKSQQIALLGSWSLDLASNEVVWSDELYKMYGFDPALPVPPYTEHEKLFTPESWARLSTALQTTSEIGTPYELELETVREDGSNGWMWVRGEVKQDANGKIIGLWGAAQDITYRKKVEEELHVSEKRLKETALIAQVGGWEIDLLGNILVWTEETFKIYELPNDRPPQVSESIGFYHQDDQQMVSSLVQSAIEKGEDFKFEARLITAKKNLKWVRSIGEITKREGKVIGAHGTIQDITERKQLEEQLQIRQRMDSLGTLASGIAHDFNNILVGIMGGISLLDMDSDNFTIRQKELLSNAGKSTQRAANLIRQFQTLSKGGVEPDSIIDLYDISNEVFDILNQTTNRLITKKIEFSKGAYFVNAVPSEIHQALLNLGMNSVEAIEERGAQTVGYIRITAEDYHMAAGDKTVLPEGDYIYITFKDNGAGMSEKVLNQAFDPLFTTKNKFSKKGQGLGLAMVYNIVTRKCKGHIEINSKEGEGTTFHIYLPKAIREVEKIEDKASKEIKGGTETILVVDDEEVVRMATTEVLTPFGYTVITASDGGEAMEVYKKQKDSIDLVILDLNMPIMSGQEVFQEMLKIVPAVKVIISSGHDEDESTKGILAQAHGNIGKPYKMEDLARTVREVLDI